MAKILLITDKKLCLEHCIAQKHEITHIEDALEEINSKKYHVLSPDTKHTYLRDYSKKYDVFVIDDINGLLLEVIKSNTESNKRRVITINMPEYKHTIRTSSNLETKWQEMGEKLYDLINNKDNDLRNLNDDLTYMCNQVHD